MPCNDEVDCKDSNHTEQVAPADQHDHENEACTPFCVCSCCAAHIFFQDFKNDFSIHNEITTVYTEPANADISSAIIPIWQPPKLTC